MHDLAFFGQVYNLLPLYYDFKIDLKIRNIHMNVDYFFTAYFVVVKHSTKYLSRKE